MPQSPDPALEAEIARLGDLDLRQLRERWAERLGSVPAYQSADLLRRHLAYNLQIRAYGGLKPEARQTLRKLYKAFRADANYTPVSNYGLKPGTVLTREWKGVTHRVGVLIEGFEYKDRTFTSLSEIAALITGSKWSGPVFFGLRETQR